MIRISQRGILLKKFNHDLPLFKRLRDLGQWSFDIANSSVST
ncbi:hypothetical protein [Elizabethkingia ursingii]|nr:hypothetical protein [Elizabethkingia ursingii]